MAISISEGKTKFNLSLPLSKYARFYILPVKFYDKNFCNILIYINKLTSDTKFYIDDFSRFCITIVYKQDEVSALLNSFKWKTETIRSRHMDILNQPIGIPQHPDIELVYTEDVILSVHKSEDGKHTKNQLNLYLLQWKNNPNKFYLVATRTYFDSNYMKKISRTKALIVFRKGKNTF